jgi:hypothetical protein
MKTARSVLAFRIATVAFAGLVLTSNVWAHYLWVTIDTKSGDHGTTNIYFEGGAGPGDGQYNDPFVKRGKTWIQTLDAEKPAEVKMADTKKPGKRWLSAELPEDGPRSVTSYGKWGVYTYGKTEVLLHYYSKLIDADSAGDFFKLGRSGATLAGRRSGPGEHWARSAGLLERQAGCRAEGSDSRPERIQRESQNRRRRASDVRDGSGRSVHREDHLRTERGRRVRREAVPADPA